MDNITHSLAGLVAGEWALRRFASADNSFVERYRPWFWGVSVVSNNFPDLDILWSRISGPTIGYLLQHRGHSHTFVMALVQGLVLGGLALFLMRRRGLTEAIKPVLFLAVAGGFIHIGLDYLNSYGVHPFWPMSGRWFYGDSIFIVEVLLWVTLSSGFFFLPQPKVWIRLFWIFAVVTLGLLFFTPYIPKLNAFCVLIVSALCLGLQRSVPVDFRPQVAAAFSGCVIVFFFLVSNHVRNSLASLYPRLESHFKLTELILSPLPSNPLCWAVHTVEKSVEAYRMQRWIYAPFPGIMGVEACPTLRFEQSRLADKERSKMLVFQIKKIAEWTTSGLLMQSLRESHCGFKAFLQFARAPFVAERDSNQYVFGDARFDFQSGYSFALWPQEKEPKECPKFLPGWECPFQF